MCSGEMRMVWMPGNFWCHSCWRCWWAFVLRHIVYQDFCEDLILACSARRGWAQGQPVHCYQWIGMWEVQDGQGKLGDLGEKVCSWAFSFNFSALLLLSLKASLAEWTRGLLMDGEVGEWGWGLWTMVCPSLYISFVFSLTTSHRLTAPYRCSSSWVGWCRQENSSRDSVFWVHKWWQGRLKWCSMTLGCCRPASSEYLIVWLTCICIYACIPGCLWTRYICWICRPHSFTATQGMISIHKEIVGS